MKNLFFSFILLLNGLYAFAQELPMPFPTDTTDWIRKGNDISKSNIGLDEMIHHNTSKDSKTYSKYHTSGNVALVSWSEWNEFWQLFNEIQNTEELEIFKDEKSGFSTGEPLSSALNYSKLKSSELKMKTVFYIVLGSTIHYYSFVMTDRLFFASHSIMSKNRPPVTIPR